MIKGAQAGRPSAMSFDAEYDGAKRRVTLWAAAAGKSRTLTGRGVIWSGTPTEALELAGAIMLALKGYGARNGELGHVK